MSYFASFLYLICSSILTGFFVTSSCSEFIKIEKWVSKMIVHMKIVKKDMSPKPSINSIPVITLVSFFFLKIVLLCISFMSLSLFIFSHYNSFQCSCFHFLFYLTLFSFFSMQYFVWFFNSFFIPTFLFWFLFIIWHKFCVCLHFRFSIWCQSVHFRVTLPNTQMTWSASNVHLPG